MNLSRYLIPIALAALSVLTAHADEPVTLVHVHGLSYSPDGTRLMIPSHVGLAVHGPGGWTRLPGPGHDYMGFTATADALYSSGHPAPGSGLVNPFGLIKSTDGGRTWRKLGFEGESDFHVMAAGYRSNAIYVFNPHPNARMRTPGIYSTRDDGRSWQRASARGLAGELHALAVHPSDPAVVAAATQEGLYLSTDSGMTFRPLVQGRQVLSASFDLAGKDLWFGGFEQPSRLWRIGLDAQARPSAVLLPRLGQDAVAYIAQNPANQDEIAVATLKRSVFVSGDRGRTWMRIAAMGRTSAPVTPNP